MINKNTFDSKGRLERTTNDFNGSYIRYEYPPEQNVVRTFATITEGQGEAYSATFVDGHGRTRISISDLPNAPSGVYSAVITEYDILGRAKRQTTPTEVNAQIQPSGDDAPNMPGRSADGWLWTSQEYDWKSRVTKSINTDGTFKLISYTGCGCAGGEITTIQSEQLTEGRRTQKAYSDFLGRTYKTEILNWDNSVYSTTLTTFNALDQATNIKEYAGGTSGTFQETTFTFDGHSRLKTRHVPIQSNGTVTTYNYNADDSPQSMIDARGVTTNYLYNSRAMVTDVSFVLPQNPNPNPPITTTNPIHYDYDAVGNRTYMSDGTGNTSYQYNQLSQLASETKTFSEITSRTFTISYGYNLTGQLTSITDPFNVQTGYQFDKLGRLTKVTGSGLGVNEYISQIDYRAWGAAKQISYGNTLTTKNTYNNRLLISRYEGLQGSTVKFGANYQYYEDGLTKYSQDLADNRMDRSYKYDHAARLIEAKSGAEARGEPNTNDRPYLQTYAYDVWGNTATRNGMHWDQNNNFSASYTNNRNNDNAHYYDADGRFTLDNTQFPYLWITHSYDAAGVKTKVSYYKLTDPHWLDNYTLHEYDGDGLMVKEDAQTACDTCYPPVSDPKYYVRSSLLGGAVIVTVNKDLQREGSYVYAKGQMIASRMDWGAIPSTVVWQTVASTGSSVWYTGTQFGTNGNVSRTELDPVGADVGTENPYLNGGSGGGNIADDGDLFARHGDVRGLRTCFVDGVEQPCVSVIRFAQSDVVQTVSLDALTPANFVENCLDYEAGTIHGTAGPGGTPSSVTIGTRCQLTIVGGDVPTITESQSDCGKFVEDLVRKVHNAESVTFAGRNLLQEVGSNNEEGKYKNMPYTGFKLRLVHHQGGFAMAHIQGIAGARIVGDNLVDPTTLITATTGTALITQQLFEDNEQLLNALEIKINYLINWRHYTDSLKARGLKINNKKLVDRHKANLERINALVEEKKSELADDQAGLEVGDILKRFKEKGGDERNKLRDQIRNEIFNLLCVWGK